MSSLACQLSGFSCLLHEAFSSSDISKNSPVWSLEKEEKKERSSSALALAHIILFYPPPEKTVLLLKHWSLVSYRNSLWILYEDGLHWWRSKNVQTHADSSSGSHSRKKKIKAQAAFTLKSPKRGLRQRSRCFFWVNMGCGEVFLFTGYNDSVWSSKHTWLKRMGIFFLSLRGW